MNGDDIYSGFFGMNPVNTIIKWTGGKSRLINQIRPFFNKSIFEEDSNVYIEPFAGSFAMALYLKKKKMILNDKNIKLMNFFEQVKIRPRKLLNKINKIIDESESRNDKEVFYYEKREFYNKLILVKGNSITVAALFWYLNKTGFNGMYRETASGKFNIPFGKRLCPRPDVQKFSDVSCAIKNAVLLHKPFKSVCAMAKQNDIVYLDPPYIPVSKTSSFSSYLRYGFGIEDHKILCDEMKKMSNSGVYIVMSNSFCDMTEQIYSVLKKDGFTFHEIEATRLISGKSQGRGKIKELIITNMDNFK